MAIKGVGLVDEVRWEGDLTVTAHLIYVALTATNVHDPELYLGFDVMGLSPATMEADIGAALRDRLTQAHGITFDVGDDVRVVGVA